MDSTRKTFPTLRSLISFRILKNSSVIFFTYDDILLKLYIEITKTGDFQKLVKKGKASDVECLKVWEGIIKVQEKETGTNQYSGFLALNKGYMNHINDHTTIRATLIFVILNSRFIDWEHIKYLNSRGYPVDVSSREKLIESCKLQMHRCENLVTKAVTKRKELEKILEINKDRKDSGDSFEGVMAALNFAWPNPVSYDITLKTYNEYQKILKKRFAEEQKLRNKNG